MNITAAAIEKRKLTYFLVILMSLAGLFSFFNLGQLEDPEFTVKVAVITTQYPGASPEEVEQEVTDLLEVAIQEMSQIDYLESFSRAGFSQITVNIKPEYWADRLPQVWDELRRKIRDAETQLPPGVSRPQVGDDYGDVFGFQLALIGDGYSMAEMEEYAKVVKRELSLIPNVARIDFWGVQSRVIYVETSQTQIRELGLSGQAISLALETQNMVVDSGSLDTVDKRFRIAIGGKFNTVEEIGNLQVASLKSGDKEELIRIRDIATVTEGYVTPPVNMMFYNGQPAIGISMTPNSGVNVVNVGKAIDKRLDELIDSLPIGIEIRRIHWQSEIVNAAVQGFVVSFGQAVAIVLVILALSMGWRMGVVIGTSLILTILVSFVLMALFGIDLQRMSLGALVIALGMMVDNAIVVADGMVVRAQGGMNKKQAAIESARGPAMPLLGATIIAVVAFYPIFASVESAGEYCRTLFTVVAISLLASWLVAMTVTPLQCLDMLPIEKAKEGVDPYGSKFFVKYRALLAKALRLRYATLTLLVCLLVVSVFGMGRLEQMFFPFSSMTKFMVDYWAPEGTRIERVADDIKAAETKLIEDERIESVSTFVGQGPPRFYLPVDPEPLYQSYAQMIVNVHDFRDINGLLTELDDYFDEEYPQALVNVSQYGVGPSNSWKFELRISGPSDGDPKILREYARKVAQILKNNPDCAVARTDWRQPVQKISTLYNQEQGRWTGITRENIGEATKRAYDGLPIGLYRENDQLIPIVLRHSEDDRKSVGNLDVLQVNSSTSNYSVPLIQVTDGLDLDWEDPMRWRRDRKPTITVQANPVQGVTLPALRNQVVDEIEAIELPEGYTLEWGGEYEDTISAQASLVPGVVPAMGIVLIIIIALFNAYRPLFVILLTIPFALIGIVAGLLPTGTPFGFLALLGAMSLVGMMIKNAIVLIDQINIELADGKKPYDAVVIAALSRLRPVVLAAATTVLGVIPLLQDVFWVGMAITIMSGLTFGTALTMIVVPVLYCVFYKIKEDGVS